MPACARLGRRHHHDIGGGGEGGRGSPAGRAVLELPYGVVATAGASPLLSGEKDFFGVDQPRWQPIR